MADLVFLIKEADRPERRVPVVVGMVLGRSDACDCVIGKDGWTSKRHAKVVLIDGKVQLEDLGSANKTQVINGPTLEGGQRYEVTDGVQFGLGKAILTVGTEAASDVSSSPAFEKGPAATERETDFIDLDSGEFREGDDLDLAARTDAAPSFPAIEPYARSTGGPAHPPLIDSPPEPAGPLPSAPAYSPPPPPAADESFGARTQVDDYEDPLLVKPRAAAPPPPIPEAPPAPGLVTTPEPAGPVPAPPPAAPEQPSGAGAPVYPQTMVVSTSDHRAAEERRGRARPRLVFTDEAIRRSVFVHTSEFLVGRRKSEEQEVHCVLPHDAVSSVHAKIAFDGHHFYIEDLGSSNNTFVDGEKLQPHQQRVLAPETAIRFGVIEAIFVVECEPGGDPIQEELYETAVGLLLRRRLITKEQAERTKKKAGEPRLLGETLLLDGLVPAEQWSKAFRHAEKIGALREVTHRSSSKTLIVGLSALIGVAAIAILTLLVLLLLR